MADKWQITLFLVQFKECLSAGKFGVWGRSKNNEFLAKHGMTPEERKGVLWNLQVSDYQSGPEEDFDYPGEKDIWKFRKSYLDIQIYIKIKLTPIDDGFYAQCLSFHD